ncbi:MAG: hypothetical protein Q9165_007955 [Trypethelium subeluteriae]
MADDDNFDIDIYGDDVPEEGVGAQGDGDELNFEDDYNDYPQESSNNVTESSNVPIPEKSESAKPDNVKPEDISNEANNEDHQIAPQAQRDQQQISSTSGSAQGQLDPPRQQPIPQGIKRENDDGVDVRPVDPGATSALRITDLQWWISEEDIRGWANQETCEDELRAITFNEHKVNGKSKGEVYVELESSQAATALKRKIDSFSESSTKKYGGYYASPNSNPYRTLPKDAPNRKDFNKNQGTGNQGSQGGNYSRGNFNNRGGFSNRGGGGMGGNYNQGGRNFNNPMGGMNGGFGSSGGNMGFNPQMGMQGMGGNFGGFNRGGGMGNMNNMRGGMANRGRGEYGDGTNPRLLLRGHQGFNLQLVNPRDIYPGEEDKLLTARQWQRRFFAVHPEVLDECPDLSYLVFDGLTLAGNSFGGGNGGHFNPAFFGNQQGGGNQGGGGGDMNPHGAKRARGE